MLSGKDLMMWGAIVFMIGFTFAPCMRDAHQRCSPGITLPGDLHD